MKEKNLYRFLIIVGIIFMGITFIINDIMPDNIKKTLTMLTDLGIGLFTSGLVGITIYNANKKNREKLTSLKRQIILSDFKIVLRSYITCICRNYRQINYLILKKNLTKKLFLKDIFTKVKEFEKDLLLSFSNKSGKYDFDIKSFLESESTSISELIDALNKIIKDSNIYIIENVFTDDEVQLYTRLNKNLTSYNEHFLNNDYAQACREKMNIYTTIETMIDKIEVFKTLETFYYK